MPAKNKSFKDLLSSLNQTKLQAYGIKGSEAFFEKLFFDFYKSKKYEIKKFKISSKGITQEVMSEAAGMGLFSAEKLLVLELSHSPAKWSVGAHKLFDKLTSDLLSDQLHVCLRLPASSRFTLSTLNLDCFDLSVPEHQKKMWLDWLNKKSSTPLANEKINYLASMDEDFSILANYHDLWTLGGDTWARAALAYLEPKNKGVSLQSTQPAFDWVDAVIRDQKKRALLLQEQLFDLGQDPFQLIALLSKSLVLIQKIETKSSLEGEADFLIRKLRPHCFKSRTKHLLKKVATVDKQLKSTRNTPSQLFASLV